MRSNHYENIVKQKVRTVLMYLRGNFIGTDNDDNDDDDNDDGDTL